MSEQKFGMENSTQFVPAKCTACGGGMLLSEYVKATPIADGMMEVRVKAGEADMLHWAVKYAESVEVLAHERLRRRIAEILREALKKYDG